jgi:flavin reductase (DIM6/NTAB) family NADH-FMN oxidoreductase RutF
MTDDSVAERFDQLVGALNYPMFIVTTTDGTRRAGCLVGFSTQASIDPPRFTVGLSKQNHTFLVAGAAEFLAVHQPTRDQLDLAVLFGTRTGFDTDKCKRCAWHRGPHGVPLLTDCTQWFVGRILARQDTGDHQAILLEPVAAGDESGLGQLSSQELPDISPGNDA